MAKPNMSERGVRRSLKLHRRRLRAAQAQRLAAAKNLSLARKHITYETGMVKRREGELHWYATHHHQTSPRQRVIDAGHRYYKLGVKEEPPGSNSGPYISDWQRATARGATYLDHGAWCGIFAENMCRQYGGVQTSPRWASVALIEDDARAGQSGFSTWTLDASKVQPGDLVVLFGRGVHVEIVRYVKNGLVYTVGGNTSYGPGGSQSNGGCVAERVRALSDVHGFALVHYPSN